MSGPRLRVHERPVFWTGPLTDCDIDHRPFVAVMYDAKTKSGPWGNLCDRCFEAHGVGLGTGLGQRYERQDDGRWLRTAG